MSHRISIQAAKEKREWEEHCRELTKAGLPVGIPRWRKKQLQKESKYRQFIEMLKKRGGLYKEEEKEQTTTEYPKDYNVEVK